MSTVQKIINHLRDPKKKLVLIRKGLKPALIEYFLKEEQSDLAIKDILIRLNIPSFTYFAKRKIRKPLDPSSSEKFLRLFSVMLMASNILGKEEAKSWLKKRVISIGNRVPLDLLDTEVGHNLITQTLLQIQYGIYS